MELSSLARHRATWSIANFAELKIIKFEVQCQSAKNAKIMRLENLALYGNNNNYYTASKRHFGATFQLMYNTQMVSVALGPWASHSEDRAEP